ncbi:MAG: glycerophosphoryl diester phosphodiesterase membrane domain-containing protein [Chloroflexi bacterium]|nr:glycerophosphoryl diester phosphodiesterase membrane domain-containing protein [Chloroflexota bacterium]
MQRESRPEGIGKRDLGGLLNETFSIYGRHFQPLVGLVAVVQLPVSLLTLLPREGVAVFTVLAIVSLFASVCVFSATVYAVGQHYVIGRVRIRACYSRVYWRIVTLTVITLILGAAMALGIGLWLLIFPTVLLIAFLVYWSLAIPSVVVEGRKPVPALRRSFQLVRGSWWRVFGIFVVVSLILLGLGILIVAPLALISRFAAPEESNLASQSLQFVGNLLVSVVVPPVAAIAATLLYYDLRVRKENYDLNALSQEMGIAPA